jgi:ABC-type phosphate transport system substrate-binding protein
MKLHSAGLAALSLAIALGLSACGGDKQAAQQPAADGAAAPAAAGAKVTAEVSGAGASFIFPLVSKWSADYNASTGAKINYQSIGSGGGIAQIKAGTVDFGSSDKPLSSEELAQAGLAQFPSAIGGVVPVVNIEGLEAGKLRLSGALLADIFLGKVKTWNDPAIVAANPGVKLPDGKITLVHRSDGSGTTFNFSNYLSKVSPEWKSKVGEGTSVQWPDGVGGKGNEGVASYVKQIKGSIGYVELAYALQNKHAVHRHAERGRQLGRAERGNLRRRGRQRRLGQRQGLQPGHHQRAGRAGVADHRHQLHADAEAAEGRQAQPGHPGLLQVGLRERPGPGQRAALRAAAGRTGQADRGLLGDRPQVMDTTVPARAGTASSTPCRPAPSWPCRPHECHRPACSRPVHA